MTWTRTIAFEHLRERGQTTVKIGERQVALFACDGNVLACNNRCPHEGYPLAQGTLDASCVLTCNWHNWKFDLASGANLTGGDALRVYPARVVDGEVWIQVTDPPPAERQATALASLRAAFDDHAYDRIARELARLAKAGGDRLDGLRQAIVWSHDRLEYGATHAMAGAEVWLRLHDSLEDPAARLSCLVEAVAHLGWDSLREPSRPFTPARSPFTPAGFLDAIEAQDEDAAVARMNDALAGGMDIAILAETLSRAALSHYADFGHALIYVAHAEALVARLGPTVEKPLLLALVRALVNASREDMIPEFRAYAPTLASWQARGASDGDARAGDVAPAALLGRDVPDTLARTAEAAARGATPAALYAALLGANALNFLRFDLAFQARTDNSVAENVGWLDVTHGVTFANAVRRQCRRFPSLWPQGLLQMACFAGRNRAYTDAAVGIAAWLPGDRARFLAECRARLLDHGERDYIHSVHYLKTTLAVEDELANAPPETVADALLAALNRFYNSPLKRKHVARTARQALDMVARED